MAKNKESDKRDPRSKFIELAEKRVTRAIKDIRLVGNLANKKIYTYDEKDAKKIVRAIQNEVKILRDRFLSGATEEGNIFSLKEG